MANPELDNYVTQTAVEPRPLQTVEFKPFPKMARLSREAVITEKLDGTNAQVVVELASDAQKAGHIEPPYIAVVGDYVLLAGSRTKWITPGKQTDNYGFAMWVKQNAAELAKLGPGQHFGEWMGCGINRSYNLSERRFYLFNSSRWTPFDNLRGVYTTVKDVVTGQMTEIPGPGCCYVVPVIWRGTFDTIDVLNAVGMLRSQGSFAVPGFMQPEGVVVFHPASGQMFKKTLEKDESPKGVPGLTDPKQLIRGVEAAQKVFEYACRENPCTSVAGQTHGHVFPTGGCCGE